MSSFPDAPLALIGYSPAAARALRAAGLIAVEVPDEGLGAVMGACRTLRFSGALVQESREVAAAGAADPDASARRAGRVDAVAFTPDEQPVLCRLVEEGRGLYGLHEFDAASSRTLEVAQWAAMGESQRLANHIPNEFVCYGTDLVLANTEWGGDEGRYAVLRDPVVVRAFVELFDRLWAASTTVDDGVDTTSERLVELMQAGLKDEAIARVLGVSLRTVRRRIAALMDECDVETRFQLAVELTERGIVGSGGRRGAGA